jgi:hypothetical protein
MWLDMVTYLHHHGPEDAAMKMPWYRGEEWSYLRGGLTTLDRDYGIFNKIHHNIETHVVHHLVSGARRPRSRHCGIAAAGNFRLNKGAHQPWLCGWFLHVG